MKIEILIPDEYSWARMLINDQWMIICTYTIMGSTRVCLHQKNVVVLQCNWCAGKQPEDIVYLVNVMLGYLEAQDQDIAPLCSNIKPYHKDEKFKAIIKPYYKVYINSIQEMLFSEVKEIH